jgi:hypothetical protein
LGSQAGWDHPEKQSKTDTERRIDCFSHSISFCGLRTPIPDAGIRNFDGTPASQKIIRRALARVKISSLPQLAAGGRPGTTLDGVVLLD